MAYRSYFSKAFGNSFEDDEGGKKAAYRPYKSGTSNIMDPKAGGTTKKDDKSGPPEPQPPGSPPKEDKPAAGADASPAPAAGRGITKAGEKGDEKESLLQPVPPEQPKKKEEDKTKVDASIPGMETATPLAWMKYFNSMAEWYTDPNNPRRDVRLAFLAREQAARVAMAPPDQVADIVAQGLDSPVNLDAYHRHNLQGLSRPFGKIVPNTSPGALPGSMTQQRVEQPWAQQAGERSDDYDYWLAFGGGEKAGAPSSAVESARSNYQRRHNPALAPKGFGGKKKDDEWDREMHDFDSFNKRRGL